VEQAEYDQYLGERAVSSECTKGGSSGVVAHAAPKIQRFCTSSDMPSIRCSSVAASIAFPARNAAWAKVVGI